MKADNTKTGHNRIIHITEIPVEFRDGLNVLHLPGELTITINYVLKPNEGDKVSKAIMLDNLIIPAILKSLNTDDTHILRRDRGTLQDAADLGE